MYLTSFYGSAQVHYEWRGEVLAIFDDPWSYPEEHPRLVYPDDDGRYAIIQPWLGVSASYGEDLIRRHPDALAIQAGGHWPGSTMAMTSATTLAMTLAMTSVMAAYLCDHPGAHDRQQQSLEAAITKLGTP